MVERIECERETDGRWMAEIVSLAGAMEYGSSDDQAAALALEVALSSIPARPASSDDTPSD